jgi:Domain of unknown function (DUF4372)
MVRKGASLWRPVPISPGNCRIPAERSGPTLTSSHPREPCANVHGTLSLFCHINYIPSSVAFQPTLKQPVLTKAPVEAGAFSLSEITAVRLTAKCVAERADLTWCCGRKSVVSIWILLGAIRNFSEEPLVNSGKTLFAQLMDFLPWSTFARIVVRYDGDARVRTLRCAEQYRAMAFAQLTYRESLRDIEVCLSAQPSKLYHMVFHEPVRRSTLADANEARDWRIYAEYAHRLIAKARKLYADDSLGLELTNTVYALDSTTIDLCLSLFPWAHFRST